MQSATDSLPALDFPQPTIENNRPRFITELGRQLTFVPSGLPTTTTTVPLVPPTSVATPTTVKKSQKPPATTPATDTPPTKKHPKPTIPAGGP
jgi:hypothetical protein